MLPPVLLLSPNPSFLLSSHHSINERIGVARTQDGSPGYGKQREGDELSAVAPENHEPPWPLSPNVLGDLPTFIIAEH